MDPVPPAMSASPGRHPHLGVHHHPRSALTGAGVDLASITAGDTKARSTLMGAWLAGKEDTEDGADAGYPCVPDREITNVTWPPGVQPGPADASVYHLAGTVQRHTGAGRDRAAGHAARQETP